MSNPQDTTSIKCFSGILRRLLCTGSLPTHPSDELLQLNSTDSTHPISKTLKPETKPVQAPSTPGIVARLMGLESLPDANYSSHPTRTTLDSILRSRSVNYVDYLPQFELTKPTAADHHRRVRTSVSFREVPTFLHPQNQDFFFQCFDKVNEAKKPEVGNFKAEKEKKVEIRSKNNGSGRERVSVKKREKQENNMRSCKGKEEAKVGNVLGHCKKDIHRKPNASLKGKSPVKPRNRKEEVFVELKCTKKRESRFTAKNSSYEFLEAPISEDSGIMGLNSRKKVSQKMRKYDRGCPNIISRLKDGEQELRAINSKANKKPLKSRETDYFINMLIEVCRLTEEDHAEGSVWVAREQFKFEDFEVICIEFGRDILEMLLYQVVHELCVSSHD